MNTDNRSLSEDRLLDLFAMVNQIDMADCDRTRIKELITQVAHLKFCKGYDAARDFYRTHYDLRLLPCKQATRTFEELSDA